MRTENRAVLVCFAILVLLLLMTVSYSHATTVREVSIDEMLQKSELIFEGTATAVEVREDNQKRIRTCVTFEIGDSIKGQYGGRFITLSFLGGTIGDVTMTVSDMRLPQKGEHGIYFVESVGRRQANPLYGWSQGHFVVEPDSAGSERVMTNRRLPVIGIREYAPDQQMTSAQERAQVPSKGVSRDVVVGQEGKAGSGMTVDDFKKALHERIARSR
jgi:hypothetical protein